MTRHRWPTAAQRIRDRIAIDETTGCWNWQGLISVAGYGRMTFQHRQCMAHRLSYEEFVGPIPDDLPLDHLCRNRACVNPEHLEPVTAAENQRRARQIGYDHPNAPTTCKRGHERTEASIYYSVRRNGRVTKGCATCRHERYIRSRDGLSESAALG